MSQKQLKFATFNVYNLQLPGKPMYHGKTYSKAEYNRKLDWTATILLQLDADIIGFQELWTPKCLQDAFAKAGLDGEYELITTDAYPNSVSVALAVRSPHKATYSRWIKEFPKEFVLKKRKGGADEPDYEMSVKIDRFSRPVLRTTVAPKMDTKKKVPDIVVCVAHLKSKLAMKLDKQESSDSSIRAHSQALGSALSTIRRTAEAAALRVLLNKMMRNTDIPAVVLGDLNDAQLSVTASIITGQPKYRLFSKSRIGIKNDRGLYVAATLQELRSLRDVYYTHIHDGQRESLDHILVSEQFYDYSQNRIWSFREMRIFNDYLEDDNKATSDHGAVVATFDYNPIKK